MDPLWSETCWSTFKYFIILIVSTYYILCISWIMKCLIIVDAPCKHEDLRLCSMLKTSHVLQWLGHGRTKEESPLARDMTKWSDFESLVSAFPVLRRATGSFVVSGLPHETVRPPPPTPFPGRIFIKFDIFRKYVEKFISVFNQLDAQNLFHNKFYFMPLHVSSTYAHH